ncbi:putative enoyl-CoA hydratase/isomerase YngF [Nymphon striatum]|nr:putative enoyl-CoA hydratase/isomerase YngF [Nymphon striatum]
MKTDFETLVIDDHGDMVLQITLNRPKASNAFNTQMARDLVEVFEELALVPTEWRAGGCDRIMQNLPKPKVKIGIIPGAGGTQTLARAIGERRAKELIMSGVPFTARQAMEWGLVNAVYSAEALLPAAIKMAKTIAANAPIAVRQAKQAIHKGLQMGLMDGLAFEIEAYNRTVPTQDRREGVSAFNEKRPPKFEGR